MSGLFCCLGPAAPGLVRPVGLVPPLGLAACKRELARCRTLLAPQSPDEETRSDYGEACLLEAWTGYLLDTGADAGQTRDVERKTARLMEACHG